MASLVGVLRKITVRLQHILAPPPFLVGAGRATSVKENFSEILAHLDHLHTLQGATMPDAPSRPVEFPISPTHPGTLRTAIQDRSSTCQLLLPNRTLRENLELWLAHPSPAFDHVTATFHEARVKFPLPIWSPFGVSIRSTPIKYSRGNHRNRKFYLPSLLLACSLSQTAAFLRFIKRLEITEQMAEEVEEAEAIALRNVISISSEDSEASGIK